MGNRFILPSALGPLLLGLLLLRLCRPWWLLQIKRSCPVSPRLWKELVRHGSLHCMSLINRKSHPMGHAKTRCQDADDRQPIRSECMDHPLPQTLQNNNTHNGLHRIIKYNGQETYPRLFPMDCAWELLFEWRNVLVMRTIADNGDDGREYRPPICCCCCCCPPPVNCTSYYKVFFYSHYHYYYLSGWVLLGKVWTAVQFKTNADYYFWNHPSLIHLREFTGIKDEEEKKEEIWVEDEWKDWGRRSPLKG